MVMVLFIWNSIPRIIIQLQHFLMDNFEVGVLRISDCNSEKNSKIFTSWNFSPPFGFDWFDSLKNERKKDW